MKKTYCNRCGSDDYYTMYGRNQGYVAFHEYLYKEGDLCKTCDREMTAFLAGHAVPAVKERKRWRRLTRKELRAIKEVGVNTYEPPEGK